MTWPLFLAAGMLLGAISQSFGDARTRARQGIVGDWVYSDPTRRSGGGLNAYPQAAQVTTVTVANVADNLDVIITINGVNVTINTATGLDAAGIGAALAVAINAEPLVRAAVLATFSVATLTLTGINRGLAFTVSIASDPNATLSAVTTTTAAASATAIPFGRAVVFNGYNPGYPGNTLGETERLVMLPLAAAFTAQVITGSYTFVASNVVQGAVYEIRGSERILIASAIFVSATDVATSTTGLVAALNAALPANTVIVTGTSTVILTAEVPGLEFDFEFNHNSGGASSPVFTITKTTGPSTATSIHRAWLGVSKYRRDQEAATLTSTEGQYAANAGVEYGIRGVMWVLSDEAVVAGETVFVETVAGATCGRFYRVASATRVALSTRVARWERDGLVSTDSLAALRLEA